MLAGLLNMHSVTAAAVAAAGVGAAAATDVPSEAGGVATATAGVVGVTATLIVPDGFLPILPPELPEPPVKHTHMAIIKMIIRNAKAQWKFCIANIS
jgi:hypothetical protein